MAYSPENSEVHTAYENKAEEFTEIAYDSFTDKLYWSGHFVSGPWAISRANRNGTGFERAVPESECKFLLDFQP